MLKIIISADSHDGGVTISSKPPRIWNIKLTAVLATVAVIVIAIAIIIQLTAKNIARGWIESGAPIAVEIAQQIKTQRLAKDAQERQNARETFKQQIAGLCANIMQLQQLGSVLSERLRLENFGDYSAANCESVPKNESPTPLLKTPSSQTSISDQLNNFQKTVRKINRRYQVMLGHSGDIVANYNAVPVTRPISGKNWLSSRYGMRRDPLTGRRAFHSGYDYAAKRGTPVLAGATGIVIYAGWLGNYGNAIRINHGDGISTLYGHLHKIRVATHQYVRRGEHIGDVGNSGRSTGPHLHYELRVNNRPRAINKTTKQLRKKHNVPETWAELDI